MRHSAAETRTRRSAHGGCRRFVGRVPRLKHLHKNSQSLTKTEALLPVCSAWILEILGIGNPSALQKKLLCECSACKHVNYFTGFAAVTTDASSSRKIFAGPRLKRLRRDRQLTQARMAEELDVSPSYLNLMERNQRPITVQVLIRLTDVYGIEPREFMEGEGGQTIGEIEQLLADPILRDVGVPRTELQDAAEHAPTLIVAMQKLYRAYLAARGAREPALPQPADPDRTEAIMRESPVDRIRAILHTQKNFFAELDQAAET